MTQRGPGKAEDHNIHNMTAGKREKVMCTREVALIYLMYVLETKNMIK